MALASPVAPDYIAGNDDQHLMQLERDLLVPGRRQRRGPNADELPWTGVALSGGGIRSAVFGLGVLQALAGCDLLKKFDYISSVSGGGYVASSLQWWWSEKRRDEEVALGAADEKVYGFGPTDLPYGIVDPRTGARAVEDQDRNLSRLRQYGNYLAPGGGLNLMAGLAVILRTLVLSTLVWVPLLAFIFYLIEIIDEFAANSDSVKGLSLSIFDPANFAPGAGLCVGTGRCFGIVHFVFVAIPIVAAGLFVYLSIVFGAVSRIRADIGKRSKGANFYLPAGFGFIFLIACLRMWQTFQVTKLSLTVTMVALLLLAPIFLGKAVR